MTLQFCAKKYLVPKLMFLRGAKAIFIFERAPNPEIPEEAFNSQLKEMIRWPV